MRRFFVYFFAAATGYVSLSQEMIWMRLVGYITGGLPATFAHVLGFFLIGVAGGAWWAERVCARRFTTRRGTAEGLDSPVHFMALMLLGSALFYYLSIAVVARLYAWSSDLGMLAVYATVTVVSLLLGGIFTVLCHDAARAGEDVGITVSRVYLANIVGSTLGPLLTGLVLMEHLPTDRMILCLSAATALLGAAAWIADPFMRQRSPESLRPQRRFPVVPAALLVACVVAFLPHAIVYDRLLEKFHKSWGPFKTVIENRHGIIAVTNGDRPGDADILYGGGVYDGRFTTDPVQDTNGIRRCYLLAAIHPDPQDVMMVGLATASWARIAEDYDRVKSLTVVEINPGYLDVIRNYQEQQDSRTDPKMRLQIDDGRRWLLRNPDAKFDVMFQNTIWHWRSEATNLLSSDFFRDCKAHLKPGGVLFINTTYSEDVAFTAAKVFRRVVRYQSNVIATDSDVPFHLTAEQINDNLGRFAYRGQGRFSSPDPVRQQQLNETRARLSLTTMADQADSLRVNPTMREITDDNMLTEFKRQWLKDDDDKIRLHDHRWFSSERSWFHFFRGHG